MVAFTMALRWHLRWHYPMVAFKIRVLLLSSKELSPQRRVSVVCKSFLSKMFL